MPLDMGPNPAFRVGKARLGLLGYARRLLGRIRTLCRYLKPNGDDRAYLALMDREGAFDRAFYLSMNPRLRMIFRIWPERHYILVGEAAGLMPNRSFSPISYLHFCPEASQSGLAPLRHSLCSGRRQTLSSWRDRDASVDMPAVVLDHDQLRTAPFAIAVHVYYPELWEEIELRLLSQSFEFDLYVTLCEDTVHDTALEQRIAARMPGATILRVPNHGRDILPFLHLAQAGCFANYRAICKLHTKKSPHLREGMAWRIALFDGLVGHARWTSERLSQFASDPCLGLWTATGHLRRGDEWWGYNRDRAHEIFPSSEGMQAPLQFASGSMFWIKPAALDPLLALGLSARAFEVEDGRLDGTTAHAVERLFGIVAAAQGLRLVEASDLDHAVRARLLRRAG